MQRYEEHGQFRESEVAEDTEILSESFLEVFVGILYLF